VRYVEVKENIGESKFHKMKKTIALKEVVGEYAQEAAISAAASHQRKRKSLTASNALNTSAVVEGEVGLIQISKKKTVKVINNKRKVRISKTRVSKKILPTKALSNKDKKLRIMILRCQVNQCSSNQEIKHKVICNLRATKVLCREVTSVLLDSQSAIYFYKITNSRH
jgi:hypothetical protein